MSTRMPQEAPWERTPVSRSVEKGDKAVGMGVVAVVVVVSWGILEASLVCELVIAGQCSRV